MKKYQLSTINCQLKNLPKYESYKDSKIDWVGDIPEHWELKPFRSLFHFRNEKNDPVKTENILSLSIANGVTEYTEEGRGGNKRKDDLSAYKLAYPGDIVLNSMNVIVGAVGLSKYFGAISPVYYALYLRSEHNNVNYFESAFLDESFQRGLLRHGKGIMMKLSGTGKLNTIRMKVSTNDLKKIYFPTPPKEEQDKIVNFLQDKTTQIDEAIGIKKQQIALLKERKQIIIQNAVTKGLNPHAPMKDSGVDWIGDIPSHWEIKRFCNIFKFGKGLSITKENLQSVGVPCVNYGEIHSKYGFEVCTSTHELKCVDISYLRTCSKSLLKQGDFIFADTSEDLEGSGNFTYISGERELFAGYHTITARLSIQANPRFLAYLFSSEGHRNQIRQKVKGVKVYSITQSILKDITALLPSLKEQSKIVMLLDIETANIDDAAKLQQAQIDKLKEYKASLINSAVTGKIKIN